MLAFMTKKYTLACFQKRHRDAVKQASTQQPGTGHADEQMEEAKEQVDDAQHHEANKERGDDDLVLPAIKDYYKKDLDMRVKVLQEHTLSKARKASGSKSRTDAGRSSIDAGRSKNIDLFAGKPEQLGDWLSSAEVYLDSVESERPMPKIATYLRGDAQEWWKTQGKAAVGLDATFAQFADAFLARFVKAADGRKARQELSEMKHGDLTVEAFAAQFRSCAARIVASKTGTAVDSTTQAGCFQNGLKRVIVSKLQGIVELEVMSDIDLLMDAAEKVEANLEMSKAAKDDRPVNNNSSQNSGNGRVQGSYVARNQHHARSFPYQRREPSFNGGRGGRGPVGFGRGVNVVQALPPQEEEYAQFNAAVHDNSGKRCFACGEWGHIAAQCPNRAEQQAQWQGQGQGQGQGRGQGRGALVPRGRGRGSGVSSSPMVFSFTAADVDRLKRLQFGAAPNCVDVRKPLRRQNYTSDSDVDVADCSDEEEQSGSQGPPGFPVPMYTVNALSINGLKMMFDGCIAAQTQTPLRILVDTGANRNFVSQ